MDDVVSDGLYAGARTEMDAKTVVDGRAVQTYVKIDGSTLGVT